MTDVDRVREAMTKGIDAIIRSEPLTLDECVNRREEMVQALTLLDGKVLVPIGALLDIRDELLRADTSGISKGAMEAYHFLYQLASPNFDKDNPWEEWEKAVGYTAPYYAEGRPPYLTPAEGVEDGKEMS